MVRLALAALACALGPAPEPIPWSALVDRGDLVVLGEVERVAESVAVVRVERVLLGPAELERVRVVDESATPRAGRRALYFLREAPAEEPLWTPVDDGRWPVVEGEIVVVPAGVASPDELGGGRRLALEPLLARIDARIAELTPSVSASFVSRAPSGWRVSVTPDGAWREPVPGPPGKFEMGTLAPDELAALWRLIEDVRFDELPREIGRHGPELHTPARFVELFTRAGRTRVLARPWTRDDDDETQAMRERFYSVWDALPSTRRKR